MSDSHEWLVHGERLVDDTPHVRISLADVEIPGHARFTQYVFRMRRVAVTVVLDDAGGRVLLMRRHRFIVDRWVWELPGGYVDDGETPAVAAAREVEEETGWRPRNVEFVLSTQPLLGNADYPQDLYLATGAELTAEPETDEAAEDERRHDHRDADNRGHVALVASPAESKLRLAPHPVRDARESKQQHDRERRQEAVAARRAAAQGPLQALA